MSRIAGNDLCVESINTRVSLVGVTCNDDSFLNSHINNVDSQRGVAPYLDLSYTFRESCLFNVAAWANFGRTVTIWYEEDDYTNRSFLGLFQACVS